ncbi:MAG TPA: hypothetical protein VJO13_21510 [Ktedonobacterales bacterium]|nr:hypothetical protein [Ktedonobacterales bacterium]
MSISKKAVPQPDKNDPLLLVIRAQAVRMVIASLITLGILGAALIADILGSDRYKAAAAVLIVVLMLASLAIYYAAWQAIRVTLTAEYLQSRVPGYLIRTITIPLANIRSARVEKRVVLTTKYGGRYYRDFLVITDTTEKGFLLQISAYHSRDLRALLTTLKQLAPQVEYDANVQRLLYPNG